MHLYVIWRACTVPFLKRHIPLPVIFGAGLGLWLLFYLGRVYGHGSEGTLAVALEFLGMNWMAAIFLISVCLLIVDIVTVFGLLFSSVAPRLRGLALAAGVILAVIALIQGMRPPVVRDYDVYLSDLPDEMEGTSIVALSDLHIGSLIGREWLKARVDQVLEQKPDLILLLGDLFEGHGPASGDLGADFRRLSAPFGVWAVSGNHDFYGRNDDIGFPVDDYGFQILRNTWTEPSPGFVLAGVDDRRRRRGSGQGEDPLSLALDGRPPGVTVFLSHRPPSPERIRDLGVDLILSGHTHGGQIWPFGYLVRQEFPLLAGRYEIGETTAIVCRGTGTWGPRMRLWHPGEILRINLRGKK